MADRSPQPTMIAAKTIVPAFARHPAGTPDGMLRVVERKHHAAKGVDATTMAMIAKRQVRNISGRDTAPQASFVAKLFEIAVSISSRRTLVESVSNFAAESAFVLATSSYDAMPRSNGRNGSFTGVPDG